MSEVVNLGKVSMTAEGNYDPSRSYDKLAVVVYNGLSWVSRKKVPEGVAPSEANSAFWQKISERGERGPQGQSYVDKELVPIVDDLTTGGSANVLSAEQGKVLKQELTELESEVNSYYESLDVSDGAAFNKKTFDVKAGDVVYADVVVIGDNANGSYMAVYVDGYKKEESSRIYGKSGQIVFPITKDGDLHVINGAYNGNIKIEVYKKNLPFKVQALETEYVRQKEAIDILGKTTEDTFVNLESIIDKNTNKIGGVISKESYTEIKAYDDGGKWEYGSDNYRGIFIPIDTSMRFDIVGNDSYKTIVSQIRTKPTSSSNVDYAVGENRVVLGLGQSMEITPAADAKWLYVSTYVEGNNRYPSSLKVTGEISATLQNKISVAFSKGFIDINDVDGTIKFTGLVILRNGFNEIRIAENKTISLTNTGSSLSAICVDEQGAVYLESYDVAQKGNHIILATYYAEIYNEIEAITYSILPVSVNGIKTDAITLSRLTNLMGYKRNMGKRYIDKDGICKEASVYNVYAYSINEGRYFVQSALNDIDGGTASKLYYVVLNKVPSNYADYDASNVLIKSPIYAGVETTVKIGKSIFRSVIDVPKEAKAILVSSSSMFEENLSFITPIYDRNEMSINLRTADISCFKNSEGKYSVDFGFCTDLKNDRMLNLSVDAKYTGNQKPYLEFGYVGGFSSMRYYIGDGKVETRIPPCGNNGLLYIKCTIPNGTIVEIDRFNLSYNEVSNQYVCGVRLDAHLGAQIIAPENTIPAFYAASKLYPSCICNIIPNRDNNLYCYHNDADVLLHNGEKVALSSVQFAQLSDADVQEYVVVGRDYLNYVEKYKEPIPLLKDFLNICSMTGMKPIFSIHPSLSLEQWSNIKKMLYKRGLLSNLTVKASTINDLELAYSVLGNIESYILDVSVGDIDVILNNLDDSEINKSSASIGVEYSLPYLTEDIASKILEHGYFASVFDIGNGRKEFADKVRYGSDTYRELMSWGISRFTDDYCYSQNMMI